MSIITTIRKSLPMDCSFSNPSINTNINSFGDVYIDIEKKTIVSDSEIASINKMAGQKNVIIYSRDGSFEKFNTLPYKFNFNGGFVYTNNINMPRIEHGEFQGIIGIVCQDEQVYLWRRPIYNSKNPYIVIGGHDGKNPYIAIGGNYKIKYTDEKDALVLLSNRVVKKSDIDKIKLIGIMNHTPVAFGGLSAPRCTKVYAVELKPDAEWIVPIDVIVIDRENLERLTAPDVEPHFSMFVHSILGVRPKQNVCTFKGAKDSTIVARLLPKAKSNANYLYYFAGVALLLALVFARYV